MRSSPIASPKNQRQTISCLCGRVDLLVVGEPILGAACHCTSCRTAGEQLERLAGAPSVLDETGGTSLILYRKDRISLIHGEDLLREHRLKPDSPTRRVIAACCNTPMFLEFTKGHWISIYRDRFVGLKPPIEMRVMTRDAPAGVDVPADVPNLKGHSSRFMWKLLGAWLSMGFRTPKSPPYEKLT